MAYTYHGTSNLIALPNRTVQTYPSGLVRVERSFVCRKDQVAKFRNTIRVNELMPLDNGAPAIDGLYIFPEPQEIVRDDGFVEFRVTAYGRTRTIGAIEAQYIIGVITYQTTTIGSPGLAYNSAASALIPQYVQKIVLQNNELQNTSFSLNIDFTPSGVYMQNFRYLLGDVTASSVIVPYEIWENFIMSGPPSTGIVYNGITLSQGGVQTSEVPFIRKKRSYYSTASEISSVNFGIFNEFSIKYNSFFNVEFIR